MAWQTKVLDGTHDVEAFEVASRVHLPAGVNVNVVGETRASVMTDSGWQEVQVGDWLVVIPPGADAITGQALGLTRNICLLLPYDAAVQRLSDPVGAPDDYSA